MADFLGLIQTAVAPFLENKTIVYLIVLLLVGVDSFGAIQSQTLYDQENPIRELDSSTGQYFVVSNYNDISGEPMCSITDPLGLFFITETLYHRASAEEINLYCREHPCSSKNIENGTELAGCLLSDPNDKIQKGTFGGMLTYTINGIGNISGIKPLSEAVFYSWELLVLMLMIPIFLWGIDASTNS
jgi:hypothetical protein